MCALLAFAGMQAGFAEAAVSELLVDSAGAVGNELGFAVAFDGDIVASGSPGQAAGAGAVLVFDCATTPCGAPARIVPAGLAAMDHFGASLALDGDTLVVGAPGRVPAAVYVFIRTGGTWVQQARIEPPAGASAAGFGAAVALSGDRLAVGAERADSNAGAVYLFLRSGTDWNVEARVVADDAAPGDRFGRAVALDEEMLAVGAPYEAGAAAGGFARGAVYAFLPYLGNWGQMPKFVADNAMDGDLLGLSVAIAPGSILAGAPMADGRIGAAVLFVQAGSTWMQRARLTPPGGLPGDRFGWSVAFTPDESPLVGAPYAQEGCGAATLFRPSGALWNPGSEATLDEPLAGAMAGWAVAASADRFVVAAPGHAGALEHRGAIHLFGGGDALFRDSFEPSVALLACEEK
jgi:hypothetical protein